jgi:hypothetical protein
MKRASSLDTAPVDLMVLDREELRHLVWSAPRTQLASRCGVSEITIRRRCKTLDIAQPPSGYWQRAKAGRQPINETGSLSWAKLTANELRKLVWTIPGTKLADALDVSDVMLGKRCRSWNIKRPARGYWNCVRAGKAVNESDIPVDLVDFARRCRDAYKSGQPVPRNDDNREQHGLSSPLKKAIDRWVATLPEPSRVARRSHIKSAVLAGRLSTISEVKDINVRGLKLLKRDIDRSFKTSSAKTLKTAFRLFREFMVEGDSLPSTDTVDEPRLGFDTLFDVSPRPGRPTWTCYRDGAMMRAVILCNISIADLCQMTATTEGPLFNEKTEGARTRKLLKTYRGKIPKELENSKFIFITENGDCIYRKLVERVIAERTERALGQQFSLTEVRTLVKLKISDENLRALPHFTSV